jgi:alpha-amylase
LAFACVLALSVAGTGFDFKARDGKYSKLKHSFQHFTAVDFDQKSGKNSIFKIQGESTSG